MDKSADKHVFFGITLPGPAKNPGYYTSDEYSSYGAVSTSPSKGESPSSPSHKDHITEFSSLLKKSPSMSKSQDEPGKIYLDPFRKENICLLLTYMSSGFVVYFTVTPVMYYLIHDSNASSTQVSVLIAIRVLPWSFKVVFGLLSDSAPILGYRRKPYIIIGWGVYLISNIILAVQITPSVISTIFWMFIMTCGLLLADVCADTMSVERAKLESEERRGTFQTKVQIGRACGKFVGAVLGAVLYNRDTWNWGLYIWQIFLLNGFLPIIFIASSFVPLVEIASMQTNMSLSARLESVWSTLQQRAVWRPMAFIYVFNILQLANAAWNNYLIEALDFDDFDMGILTMIGALMSFVGLSVYKVYLFDVGWQQIYVICSIFKMIFSLGQLLLIFQVNKRFGIPNLVFAMGDYVLADFFISFQYMPSCIMYVTLCPDGSEGITYALLTTMSNLALAVSTDIASWMTEIWDVSNTTLQAGDYSGLIKLSILTSLIQITPLSLVFLLPNTKEDQKRMRDESKSSKLGGSILVAVVAVSFTFTFVLNIYLLSV